MASLLQKCITHFVIGINYLRVCVYISVCSKHLAGGTFTHYVKPISKLLAITMSCFKHPNCSLHVSSEGPLGLCVQYPPNHLDLRSASKHFVVLSLTM